MRLFTALAFLCVARVAHGTCDGWGRVLVMLIRPTRPKGSGRTGPPRPAAGQRTPTTRPVPLATTEGRGGRTGTDPPGRRPRAPAAHQRGAATPAVVRQCSQASPHPRAAPPDRVRRGLQTRRVVARVEDATRGRPVRIRRPPFSPRLRKDVRITRGPDTPPVQPGPRVVGA